MAGYLQTTKIIPRDSGTLVHTDVFISRLARDRSWWPENRKKLVLSLYSLSHLFALFFFSLPSECYLTNRIQSVVFLWTGRGARGLLKAMLGSCSVTVRVLQASISRSRRLNWRGKKLNCRYGEIFYSFVSVLFPFVLCVISRACLRSFEP